MFLAGPLAAAESLLHQALDYYPVSKNANFRLGRYYFDNGQQERGLQVLRRNSMLLEVPRLTEAPKIDGLLDEKIWQRAAIDTLYIYVSARILATRPSPIQTRMYVGYTRDALYMGAYCGDAQLEEFVVESKNNTGDYPRTDQVEFLFDGDLDYSTFGQIVVNSTGAVTEGWWTRTPMRQFDSSWEPGVEGAAFVGEDFWSIECRIPYAQQGLPKPRPGDVWGFNFVRLFRGRDYSQWVVARGSTRFPPIRVTGPV